MDLQEIIVFATLFACITWIGVRIYHSFKNISKGESPCEGCSSECSLKKEHSEKGKKKGKKRPCQ
ncbi:MAG: hypothetical protein ACRCZY_06630 [Phocaeicola sp.]